MPPPRRSTPQLHEPLPIPSLQDDLLMSWFNHELALIREIGFYPLPFDLPLVDLLAEFSISSPWLHMSMPDGSAEEAYTNTWIHHQ
jgi:hypothetical protein